MLKDKNILQYTEYIDNKGILGIFRGACNCVDSRLMNHGFRVAYIVSKILKRTEAYDEVQMRDICILAMLHDIGAYKTEEIDRMLEFETRNIWDHSIYGYLFIKHFSPLRKLASGILLHHLNWDRLKELDVLTRENKMIAQIINLADRTDVYMVEENHSWEDLAKMLREDGEHKFASEIVELLLEEELDRDVEASAKWDKEYQNMLEHVPFTQEEVMDYLKMIVYTIDFRSRHTVTHTMTTTSISKELAVRMGLDGEERNRIACGAILHDLGKIGIPVEILEFPGKLSPQAMNIMRTHVDITEHILGDAVPEAIKNISLRHHEKLNGSGYPRGLKGEELNLSERIVAAADIVSALAGTRSYKDAYSKDKVTRIIGEMRDNGLIDPQVVNLLISDFDPIMESTRLRCQPVLDAYYYIQDEYVELQQKLND